MNPDAIFARPAEQARVDVGRALPDFRGAFMDDLRERIKEMMVKNLMLQISAGEIADDAPLFGPDGLGLDSIDALELAVSLEKTFGVSVPNSEVATKVLRSVNTIHDYIVEKRAETATPPAAKAPQP